MSISSAFIARPIATSLLMAGILLVGAAAYPLIPVAPLPQVDFPTILVTTQLPGASPEIMASSVTQPLERQFGQIPGVTQMTSSSALGNSAITVQFDLSRSIDGAAQDIQTAINAASGQLPKNLPSPPTYRKVNPADSPILVLALTSDTVPLTEVDDYAENILDQHISQISGVANVEIGGQQKPAVRIQVDPVKVASFGLSLPIIKWPGANVIQTRDRMKAALPQLQAAIPPTVKVQVLSDRTQTIRASVADVQFTLLLTIALVVMVIFVFLRNLWATIIPSVAVPLALVGTFAIMYVLGYSLDNLSLMALTIAVGFVVDDAIVMLENIDRHLEEGLSPMEAAIKGAGEIGFTIVSISLSLVAVFIPLFLMGGIVGRLFREFGVTVSVTILVSMLVSLTLTPMMCSRFMRSKHQVRHGRLYALSERAFDLLLAGYRKSLDVALRHHRTTFAVFVATLVATGYLFMIIPKGFFPQQDTGLIIGTSEAAQEISFADAVRRQRALADIVQKDPAVATVGMSLGANGTQTQNNGRLFITLKPRNQRDVSADEVIRRLRPQLAKVEGAALFLQAAQDINIGGRPTRTQYQYTLQDANLDELNQWSSKIFDKLKTLPELRDVASDQQTGGATLTLTIDRDQAARFGIQPQLIDDTLYDAFGQRQVTQYFTQLNSYHVVLEVLPEMQRPGTALDSIYVNSPTTGDAVPLSTFVKWTRQPTNFLSINHQSMYPSVTLSFNLASGVALGQATTAIQNAETQMGAPATLIGNFQGNAQAFQASLASEPLLVAAAIIVIYIILGVLYESYVHPLTILSTLPSAGLGALATLMVFGFDFSLIALIGIILLIGIVKKNGIMLVDFAIEAQRNRGLAPLDAIREACLLRFRPIMMTTMAALLGGVPLMLGTGTGAEIRQPLGYAIVGGLIVSQALTLYTTPVVFLYLDRVNAWFTGAARPKAAPAAAGITHRQIPPAAAGNVGN